MSTSRTFTAGQVLTAAQMNDLPQGVLGYASATAGVGSITGSEVTVLTAPAVTVVAGRRIRISFVAYDMFSTVSADVFHVRIKEGATTLMEQQFEPGTGTNPAALLPVTIWTVVQPSAASHTYSVVAIRTSGTGTGTVDAISTAPMQIVVEDIGI